MKLRLCSRLTSLIQDARLGRMIYRPRRDENKRNISFKQRRMTRGKDLIGDPRQKSQQSRSFTWKARKEVVRSLCFVSQRRLWALNVSWAKPIRALFFATYLRCLGFDLMKFYTELCAFETKLSVCLQLKVMENWQVLASGFGINLGNCSTSSKTSSNSTPAKLERIQPCVNWNNSKRFLFHLKGGWLPQKF